MPLAGSHPSRLLTTVAVTTVIFYIATSPLYLWGSITPGDVGMLLVVALVLMSDRAMARVIGLLQSPYGTIAFVLTAVLVMTALHAVDASRAVVFILQLTFTVWVVVPIVTAGIADLRDPLGVLRIVGGAYLAYYAVGLVLLFGFGNDVLLYQTPIGRVFPRFTTQGLELMVLALGMAGVVFAERGRLLHFVLLLLALVPLLLGVNRTGLVSLLLVALIAGAGAIRGRRGLTTVLVSVSAAAVLSYAFVTSAVVQTLWQIRILTIFDLLEDQQRVAAMSASLADIGESAGTLLFGNGWGSGAGADIVAHNFIIQITHDSGLLVLLPFTALLLLPAFWILGAGGGNRMERHFVLMLTAVFVLFWSLNALVVERSYWITYALALGVALRARRHDTVPITPRPG